MLSRPCLQSPICTHVNSPLNLVSTHDHYYACPGEPGDNCTTYVSTGSACLPMQREGQDHFACEALVGVELENQGGEGTALQHWEKRMLGVSWGEGYMYCIYSLYNIRHMLCTCTCIIHVASHNTP